MFRPPVLSLKNDVTREIIRAISIIIIMSILCVQCDHTPNFGPPNGVDHSRIIHKENRYWAAVKVAFHFHDLGILNKHNIL